MFNSRQRLLFLGAFAAALVSVIASSALLGDQQQAGLAASSVAKIVYPGATVLAAGDTTFDGQPGFLQIYGSSGSMTEILNHYDESLSRIGFRDGAGLWDIRTTREIYACAWHGDGLVARLAFMTPEEAAERYPQAARGSGSFQTFYRWLILESDFQFNPRSCSPPPS